MQDLGNLRAQPGPPDPAPATGQLAHGQFVERGVDVLAFALPGTGNTHALCALGYRRVEAGVSVYFVPAYRLVQELLFSKRDLDLPRRLRKLDNFDFLLLDERYVRRSLGITSSLVIS